MNSNEFWELIGTLGGDIDQQSATELSERLSARPAKEIRDFADQLASALYALDSSERADQPIVDPSEGDQPIPMSDDIFLYARCAVVAAGRTAWESAVAQPSAMAGSRPVYDGEWLLTVAPSAFEESAGTTWTHVSPVSYETGSNAAGWKDSSRASELDAVKSGSAGESRAIDSNPVVDSSWDDGGPFYDGDAETNHYSLWVEPAPHRPWFELLGAAEKRLPRVPLYVHMRSAYMIAINADPAWTSWWQRSRLRDLEISLWLDPGGDESFELKKGRKICKVDVHLDGRFLTSTDRRLLLQRAHGDIERAMAFVGEHLGLGPIPPTPAGPPLPKGLDLDKPETWENQPSWSMDWPGFRTNWTL